MCKTIEITNHRQMRDFLRLPDLVYKSSGNHVHEPEWMLKRLLDEKRNPYFNTSKLKKYACYRDGAIAARAILTIPLSRESQQREISANFGYFECIEDIEAARSLFDAIERSCMDEGIFILDGPFSPNNYGVTGVLLNRFEVPPVFYEPYNPPYYAEFLKELGFNISGTGRTWRKETIDSEIPQEGYLYASGNYAVRSLNLKRLKREIGTVGEILEEALADNWHARPISLDEYFYTAKSLLFAVQPGLLHIVEYKNEPVGVLLCLLDINPAFRRWCSKSRLLTFISILFHKRRLKTVLVFVNGIKKAHRHSRAALLISNAMRSIETRYSMIASTWISTENTASEQIAAHFGLHPFKDFAVFQKRLQAI